MTERLNTAPKYKVRPRKSAARTVAVAAALAAAATMAAHFEGLRHEPYLDPVGIMTVCYGHTSTVEPGKRYSLAECRGLLTADMQEAIDQVERCQPGLPEPILAAFADAVFNMGPTVACDSTAAAYLRKERYEDACNQLPRWNKARVNGQLVPLAGLTKRRAAERELCLTGVPK